MKYFVKRELPYETAYIGIGGKRIHNVTKERINSYGFKTMSGAERAMKQIGRYMNIDKHNGLIKLSIVPFPSN